MWFPDLRVSEKRAVSLYGLNKFPSTYYAGEWKAIFASGGVIRLFIATHHAQLDCRCSEATKEHLRLQLERGEIPTESSVGTVTCRRGTKGGVSVYGIRRQYPITLYCLQWLNVFEIQELIEKFIREREDELEHKGCCVPRVRKRSELRPQRESIGPDNIIRPTAVATRD